MEKLSNGICLYHGSYCEVREPDILKCAKYKDFGRGFYLTTSLEQAKSFAKLSTKKAKMNDVINQDQTYGVVTKYKYYSTDNDNINIKIYEAADAKWLHCVVGHRKKNTFPAVVEELLHQDIIGGKIANDNTNATITAYMSDTFGKIGSDSADEICIRLLIPERLTDQFCFRTKKALSHIEYLGSEKIWI